MAFPMNLRRALRQPRTIRKTLIWIVVTCVVPAWIGVAFLIQSIYTNEGERGAQKILLMAHALVLGLDRHLGAARTTLEVMATAPDLVSGDYAAFHKRAGALIKSMSASHILLTDQSGKQLFNTLVPYGAPLPPHADKKSLDLVFSSRKAVITDVFFEPLVKNHAMGIEVPVFVDGHVKYVLTMGVIASRLVDILDAQDLPFGWIGTFLDTNGIIAARTSNAKDTIGKLVSAPLRDEMARKRHGILRTRTVEGTPVYAVFDRSNVTNWTVVVSVPFAELDDVKYGSLLLVGTGAIFLLLVGISFAGYQSRKIVSGLRSLIASATTLGHGKTPSAARSNIREINEVAQGLEKAFVVLQDRTDERDRAAREKEIAEEAAWLKVEFIGTVSHELRTPLTSIVASLGLLSGIDHTTAVPATKRLIEIAHSNCVRLTRLVNDILDIEKLEAGKVKFKPEHIEIGMLLAEAIEGLRALAGKSGVKIVCDGPPAYVHADPDRLMQVFVNLLSNAIKFSPPSSEVEVTIEDRVGKIRVTFRDHGPGIPADFRSSVFEKFAQADVSNTREKGGSGLGLSIVKGIVQRLGGDVGFSDAPGGGAIFFVELPRDESLAAEVPSWIEQMEAV
jgi:signal transduction histidine kinase